MVSARACRSACLLGGRRPRGAARSVRPIRVVRGRAANQARRRRGPQGRGASSRSPAQPAQRSDGGQHVGRVRPLPPRTVSSPRSRAHATSRSSSRRSAPPSSKRVRNSLRTVWSKPGSVNSARERVLPVDPPTYGVGRRAVGQMLGELEDRDQGQPPWCFGQAAPAWGTDRRSPHPSRWRQTPPASARTGCHRETRRA